MLIGQIYDPCYQVYSYNRVKTDIIIIDHHYNGELTMLHG